ncbi:MAG TPA: hypothetical protein VGF88_16810 [Acidobacteriaceae bacterium]|jgi:hypothetical protein
MNIEQIVAELNAEIARLEQVKFLLTRDSGSASHKGLPTAPARKKRVLSAEARERIAAAQRKRWAAQKKAARKAA